MGVKSCSRKDCTDIMCHTYVSSVGYICSDCQTEFKKYLDDNSLEPKTEGQITKELKTFMEVPKDTYTEGKEISVNDFFSKNTY